MTIFEKIDYMPIFRAGLWGPANSWHLKKQYYHIAKSSHQKISKLEKNEGSKILNFLEKFDRCMFQGPDAKKNLEHKLIYKKVMMR